MEKYKGLRIAIIVLYALMLALVFAGTITMFFDYNYYYYSYHSYDYYDNPEAGIMPLVGFILALVGFIFILCSKKKPKLLIGTIVLLFVAEVIIGVSTIFAHGYYGHIGYYVCCSGMSLNFVLMILIVVWFVLYEKIKRQPTTNAQQRGLRINIYDELRKLKELYDMGVLTQAEYEAEKAKIMQKI
ncbi:MAG: SHOCT domain-containing protein [Clostridia bacterium]|nr:SHOCT domain-containing protein [Clostridia bacterium]